METRLRLRIAGTGAQVGEPDEHDARAEVWRDVGGEVCAWAQSANGDRWMHLPGVASYRLRPRAGEITAIADPRASRELVVVGYERTVLPMAAQLAGQEVLHASAVLTVGGVVAFCAVSTTGKSTVADRLGRRGYRLWADDAVAFDPGDGAVAAIPLPFRLEPRDFPGADEGGVTSVSGSLAPEAGPALLSAVCVLERTSLPDSLAPVHVRRLSPAEAFPAVLAHAYCYSLEDQDRNRLMVDHYLELSAHVAVFSLRFRPGLGELPAVLDEVEQVVGMVPGRAV
jgi:hypothetical protein